MVKPTQITGFRDERRRCGKCNAAHGLKCRDHRRHCPINRIRRDVLCIQQFLVGGSLSRMRKVLPVEPTQMPATPPCLAIEGLAVSKQEGGDVLSVAAIVLNRHRSHSHEIPDRFVRIVWDPHGPQLFGAVVTRSSPPLSAAPASSKV